MPSIAKTILDSLGLFHVEPFEKPPQSITPFLALLIKWCVEIDNYFGLVLTKNQNLLHINEPHQRPYHSHRDFPFAAALSPAFLTTSIFTIFFLLHIVNLLMCLWYGHSHSSPFRFIFQCLILTTARFAAQFTHKNLQTNATDASILDMNMIPSCLPTYMYMKSVQTEEKIEFF